jgi:hypothetical protein
MIKSWIIDNLIINNKLVSKRCKIEWFIKNNYIEQYNVILVTTSFLDQPTFPQRIWHIINNINNIVKCQNPNCNNITGFLTYTTGYSKTCSSTCAQLNPDTINKIKNTNLKKYGCEYGLSNANVIQKKKLTCIKNHGVDNPTKSQYILSKIKTTNRNKYGVDWILSDQEKKENAINKKYGVKNIQLSQEIKNKTQRTRRAFFYDSLITSDRLLNKYDVLFSKEEYIKSGYYSEYLFKCKTCQTEFFDCLEDGDVPRCVKCYKNTSIFESEVFDYVKTLVKSDEKVYAHNRDIIHPLELDIYLPEKKLAIECNGLYWHGELNGNKDKHYHLNKTNLCEKNNIKLIHIFEDEWLFKKEIVKARLRNNITHNSNKIFARKCNIKKLETDECINFIDKYHIQGADKSKYKYGLIYNNELVSVMTFGNQRVSNGCVHQNGVYEMYRFCSKFDVTIVGGASRLLKQFINDIQPKKIISYADRRWSNGNLYNKLGFIKTSQGTPNYWYFGKGNSYKRHHRFQFAKHTLKNKFENFNPNLSEYENMKNNKYDRIWDCGSIKYELLIK